MSGWDPCKSSFVPLRIGEVEKALAYTRSILEALGPDERHIKGLDPGIFEAVIVSTNLESLPESYVQICQKLYDELGPYQMESDQKFDSLMDLMEFKLRLLRDEIGTWYS